MKYILDTSILIDYLRRGKAGKQIFDALEEEKAYLFIPTVVIYELFSGKSSKTSSVKEEINLLIGNFKKVDLTEKIAKAAGELYRDTGKTFSAQDYIIAASALEIEATVVTLNTKHFSQIPNLKLFAF
ncbi:MAG: type II toxin-antitoxin system VapC family toxin [Candidatus Levybacteria bacterium]|nr:type II toxin-antitoxin system VapC family toxin [Candidatus Levybacteria bacterium]